jgi:uncharacterized protein YidB (DUF937 family)
MGLFDQIAGELTGALGQNNPLATQLLGYVNDPQHGGLQGLVKQFHDKGLGSVVSSWVATGPNIPITPQQLQSVLGNERVQQLSAKFGITPEMLTTHLSSALPTIIDKLTPNGQVPPAAAPVPGANPK